MPNACLEQGFTHLSFPYLPMFMLYDPCKCRVKPPAYRSQGILGNVPPKGDSCILCENVEAAAEGSRCQESFLSQSLSQGCCWGREVLHLFQHRRYQATLCWLRAGAPLQQPLTWLMQSQRAFKSPPPPAFHLRGTCNTERALWGPWVILFQIVKCWLLCNDKSTLSLIISLL